ncbi:MAG: hypothetical protein H8E17_21005 [Deltaproteobacteria bacterium]|nr:hypothetical protein [Deltaproteobacteria bacterium]
MLQSDHYELLDRLRFGKDNDERKEALKALINLEYEVRFDEADFLKLLADEDPVFQVYAIGAMGRQKIKAGIPELRKIYLNASDTLILNELLTSFQQFESDDFIDIVVEKLRKLTKKSWSFLKNSSYDRDSDRGFILNQILIPSLRYIQMAGNAKVEKTVRVFLDHEDANVRWHSLMVFDKLGIPLKQDFISRMIESDPSPLVKELAAIMMEKRKSAAEQ